MEGSESKSAEEEFGMSCLFVFLGVRKVANRVAESFLKSISKSFSAFFSLKVIVFDILEIKIVDQKSCGDNVVLVDILNERLNISLFDELLLAISALDKRKVSCDTSN